MEWVQPLLQALSQEPQREHFALIGEEVLVPLLISQTVGMAILIGGLLYRWYVWRDAKAAEAGDSIFKRLQMLVKVGLLQRKVVRRFYSGLMHTLIYTGMIVLTIGTVLAALEFDVTMALLDTRFLVGTTYIVYELALETFGIFLIVGLAMALHRRVFQRPKHLKTGWGDHFLLLTLLLLSVQGFVLEAFRLGASPQQPWYPWSYVGYGLSRVLVAGGLLTPGVVTPDVRTAYAALWWFHAFTTAGFYASIPFTKFLHMITSPLNTYMESLAPYGKLSTPFRLDDLTGPGADQVALGAATTRDFSSRDRLMFDSCTECGRCTSVCPAWVTGKPLDPMQVILDLRDMVYAERRKPPDRAAAYGVGTEELWACTTCNACVETCPVSIRHVGAIVELRRNLVMEQGDFPPEAQEALQSLETNFNPYGVAWDRRDVWAEGLDVPRRREQDRPNRDLLYWVGCAAAYDRRNQQVARAMVKILRAAGLRFSILGPKEKCTGDPARRIGNEYLAQTLMTENVETLEGHGVRRILVTCPHCFNTLKNEYPDFGGNYEVVHHTQLIRELLRQGRLEPGEVDLDFAFHDSCYLGRHNGVYDEPREALTSLEGLRLREMPRCRHNQLCCGAGGGRMWMEERVGKRVNVERTEEALATGADGVAVACPFCMTMMEDGAKAVGAEARFQARDVAEIVADALEDQG